MTVASSILCFAIFFNGLAAQALEAQFVGGFRQQNATLTAGFDSRLKSSYQFGIISPFYSDGAFNITLGTVATQRIIGFLVTDPASPAYNTLGTDEFFYLDFPFTMNYNVYDLFTIHGGAALAFNLTSTCRSEGPGITCSVLDPKKVVVPFVVGLGVKITPEMGLYLFYEASLDSALSGELSANIKNYRALTLNFFVNLW